MQFQKKRGNIQGSSSSYYQEEVHGAPTPGRMVAGQRSPMRYDKDTGESGYGEMLYLDPNDVNFKRNQAMSPITEGRESQSQMQSQMRSPSNRFGTSVLASVRNDLNDRSDTAQVMGTRPFAQLNVTLDNRKRERLERSPKTINIGESEKEIEYNIRTLNARRSPKAGQQSQIMYQTNTNYNDQGNIFLDHPMNSGSFINQLPEQMTYQSQSPIVGVNPYQTKGSNEFIAGGSREIQYSMNPRDLREPIPSVIGKMSPNKNVDDESLSENKGNDTATQLKDLKTQMDRNANNVHESDGMMEHPRQIRNDMEKIDDYVKNRESRDTMTEGDFKKLVKQMTKGYDPRKGNEGRLISTSQTIIPGNSEEIFQDRYKVLQKMNKLSNILLSKNRGSSQSPERSFNRSYDEQPSRKTFDRNTLNSTITGKNRRQTINRSPQNKFLYLSLAMISSKGPNCEDRIILRKMRFDKGGVVDLAQDAQKKKNKIQIKKPLQRRSVVGGVRPFINPKHREKAAKVVQGWWRDIKGRYQKILNKIILIQSVWRGRWLRKYIYDIIYLSFLHQRFCDIIERVMVNHVRPIVWEELFAAQKWAREFLAKLLSEKDPKFSLVRAKGFFDKWRDNTKKIAQRNLRSKNLIHKKELDEKNKKLLSKYFNEWALRANLLKYIGKCKDHENRKKKFFGTLNILNGTNKLAKDAGLKTVEPKLKDLLAKRIRNNALKKLLQKYPSYQKMLMRKYFNRWNNQINKLRLKDFKHQVFGNMSNRLDSRMDRANLKTCFSLWRSKLPKEKLHKYNQGMEKLRKFALRTTHKDPVHALKEKNDYTNKRDCLLRMLGLK